MHLIDYLVWTIAFIVFVVGLIMLLYPEAVEQIEHKLNSPWGDTEVLNLRLGITGEKRAESLLNKPVLENSIVWDEWARKHPRLTGSLLLLSALLLIGFYN